MGCYPNTKQIPTCSGFFQKYRVSTTELERIVDLGMIFHAEDMSVMTINGIEDTWQVRAVGDRVSLWHNNYVKLSDKERYITDGFHDQKCKGNMTYMLHYIEGYSWKKHLEGKEQKKIKAEEEARVAVIEAERRSHWYDRVLDRIKKIYRKEIKDMNKNHKTTKEIYEEFYKRPIEEINREDIGECEEMDWGQDVGGEIIEDDYDPNDPFNSESNIKHLKK